jgi:hypothetical protein
MKVLFYDLETSPMAGFFWNRFQTDVIKVTRESELLTAAWKWLGERRVTSVRRPSFKPGSEKAAVIALWNALDEADVVIGHNNNHFDNKKARTFFLQFGLPPPSPFKSVDTCALARRQFAFSSNKLDELARFLGLGKKVKTGGFKLWEDYMNNKAPAAKKMERYNRHDVVLSELVYKKLRAWMPNHPAFYEGPGQCPRCGSGRVLSKGLYRKGAKEYTKYRCQKCQGFCYAPKSGKKKTGQRGLITL